MQLPNDRRGTTSAIDWTLVVGASLYWASVVFRYLLPGGDPGRPFSLVVRYGVLAAWVGAGFLAYRPLLESRGRRGFLAAATLVALAQSVPPIASTLAHPAGGMINLALSMYVIAVPMVVWAFAFASMDKRRAGQNVAVTMLATALWTLLLVGLAHMNTNLQVIAQLLIVASTLVAMAAPLRFADQQREPPDGSRTALRAFVTSRCICGACVGVCLAAPFSLSSAGVSLPLAAMAVLGLLAAAWMYLRSLETLYAALPALFFLSLGAVFVPFLEGGLWAAAGACTALAWFAWVSFSAFQLSAIKERCGLSELTLCLVEKTVLSASIGLGALAFGLVEHAVEAKVVVAAGPYALFGATLLLVLWISNAMARLVSARKEDELDARLSQTRAERLEAVFDQLGNEFGLSAREREVLPMLADGYTRTYIREALGISDGTAKAHIAHVYAKLDIHRKDDLLDLIDRRLREV